MSDISTEISSAGHDPTVGGREEMPLTAYLHPEVSLDELPHLKRAQQCSALFILIKELARSNLQDFWVKLAVLLFFSQDKQKTRWTPQELTTELHWLQESVRKKMIMQLSRGNWLNYSEGAYELAPFGRSILTMLTALIEQEEIPDALGANVSSLTLLEMYQQDPTNTLRMFLNELVRVDNEIQSTLESKSEYLVRKLNRRIRSQFEIAVKSRKHLENLPTSDFNSYRLKQQIHERLSYFHARLSQVQRIQDDLVARRIVLADKSLSQHDISDFLINSSVKELAAMGGHFIATPIAVPDLIPQLMVYETEWQFEKEHLPENRKSWSEMEMAAESGEDLHSHSRFLQFAGEVKHVLTRQEQFTLEQFVPWENWSMSCFRFSMLAVLESAELPVDFQVASNNVCPQLAVSYPHDDVELDVVQINDHLTGVKEITRGIVRKRVDTSFPSKTEE